MQDENIDMESLYAYLEGTPEQIDYCKDKKSREIWHEWLDNQLHFFIYEE
jgi:hypothetical protein